VGQQLRALGNHHQVLCVTHLPQVACQAHQHLQVAKLTGDRTTRTRIRPLDGDERVEEIARMLGGRTITDSTLQHAAEMLGRGTSPAHGSGSGKKKRRSKQRS
jgi:DNA repair protein RecN (Recombination protein N)